MKIPIKWTPEARNDLVEACRYINFHNPKAAIALAAKIAKATEILSDFPNLGKPRNNDGARKLVLADFPFTVIYRIKNRIIEILRIMHHSRSYPH